MADQIPNEVAAVEQATSPQIEEQSPISPNLAQSNTDPLQNTENTEPIQQNSPDYQQPVLQQYEQPQQYQQQQQQYQQQQYQQQQQQQQQQQFQQSPPISEIQIRVVESPLLKEVINKAFSFQICGQDRNGPFEVSRRLNDFILLRNILTQRWPGCYIPGIYQKKSQGKITPQLLEKKRLQMEEFFIKIAARPYLFYSEECQIFLRNQGQVIETAFASLKKLVNEDLIDRFQNAFKQLSGKEINTDLVLKISTFKAHLSKVGQMLKNFQSMAINAHKTRFSANDKFSIFMNYMLPEYEKNCLVEYVPIGEEKLIFGNQNDTKITEALQKIKEMNLLQSCFKSVKKLIKMELFELESFSDTLNQKQLYEQKKEAVQAKQKSVQLELQKLLAKGASSGIFGLSQSKKDEKVQKLEQQIAEMGQEIESLQFICDIITVILGYIEIDKFKNEKSNEYYGLLKRMAYLEKSYATLQYDLWQHVESNTNLLSSQLA